MSLTRVHPRTVNSILQSHRSSRKFLGSRYHAPVGRCNISTYFLIILCSEIQFPFVHITCFQSHFYFVLRKKELRMFMSEIST